MEVFFFADFKHLINIKASHLISLEITVRSFFVDCIINAKFTSKNYSVSTKSGASRSSSGFLCQIPSSSLKKGRLAIMLLQFKGP